MMKKERLLSKMKDSEKISLYLDTATKKLAVGAKKGSRFATFDLGNPKAALERTNLGISLLETALDFKLSEVDSFYCLLGPGSNTGIRLGLTIPRTLYAFNPTIKLFGIPTMELMTLAAPYGALSDRNGNLFFAKKENDQVSFSRIDKKEISSLEKVSSIAVENKDEVAIKELEGQNLIVIDVLSMMMKYETHFKDYSMEEENFLPEYILKI